MPMTLKEEKIKISKLLKSWRHNKRKKPPNFDKLGLSKDALIWANGELDKLVYQQSIVNVDLKQKLVNLGYTDDMLKMLNKNYRSDLLLELLDEFDHQLTVLGASKSEIIDLIITSKNKGNLQAFYNNLVNLKNKEYKISTCIEIIKKSPDGKSIKTPSVI
ncbi:hypothetical protein [Piscirickettsia salmonis]|uniref:hypothetical protein n=1 Tax=Piscirickettsia salmonis TaxID=1238 RepID=UPI003A8031F7